MRFCFLTEVFCPPILEGTALHANQLARKLTAAGMEVCVLTRKMAEASPSQEWLGDVQILRIPPAGQFRGKGWRAFPPVLLFLLRIMARLLANSRHYDVIVVFGAKTLAIPAIVIKTICRKKCVVRVESPKEIKESMTSESMQAMNLSQSSLLLRWIFRLQIGFLKRAERVIALSGAIQENLLALGVRRERIAAIPNGIDFSTFFPAAAREKLELRQNLSLPSDKTLIVYTGRIVRSKGVPMLAAAWQKLAAVHADIHLVLVGSGAGAHDSCEDEIRCLFQEQGVAETATFAGSVNNVAGYLRAADLFVFPSEWEAFGLSLVEAMACALPVVTTKVGVANDCIRHRHNGFLLKTGDQQGITDMLSSLLENRQSWPQIGANGRKKVLEQFSIEKEVADYIALFRQLGG